MEQQLSADPVTPAQKKKKLKEKSTGIVEDDNHKAIEDANDDLAANNEVHPLKNPVILSRMFQLCPVELLQYFRLVSKEWNQLSLKAWRSSCTVTFTLNDLTRKDGNFFWKPPSITCDSSLNFQSFLNYVKEPTNDHSSQPFRKFKLVVWEFRKLDDEIEQFAKICCPSITSLELYQCYFPDLTIFRDVLFKWLPNLQKLILTSIYCRWSFTKPVEPVNFMEPEHGAHQNLKHLEINNMSVEELPISCLELLSHYPRLETFKLYDVYDDSLVPMLNAIKTIKRHDPRKLQIKDLNIFKFHHRARDEMKPEICLLLRDAQLPLETLTIDFGVKTKYKRIQEILRSHATTLKSLDAYLGKNSNSCSIPHSSFSFSIQLDNLQELVISERLCKSLTFMKYMPNLKKLHIRGDTYFISSGGNRIPGCTWLNNDPKIMQDVKLVKCTDFRFDYMISVNEMSFVIKLLPNVEKIEMPMYTKHFRLACEKWTNLRDIEVLGDGLDDDAITGLSPKDVEAINKAEKEERALEFSPVAIHPNITDLKHLQTFKMTNEDDPAVPTKLMDCSAVYGFLKLPYLQTLHLTTLMSDRAKKALVSKIPD